MDYGAITVDTSIFDEKGLRLEVGILKTLEQFKGKPYPLILSEIVLREMQAHITKKARESRHSIEKSIKGGLLHLALTETCVSEGKKSLIPTDNDYDVAKRRLSAFIDATGADIIPAAGQVDLQELIANYFDGKPPFAETGKKKSEFPDAIALMSLEAWAKNNRTKLLAVSTDNDWGRFSEHSDYVDVIGDLAEAISLFQPDSDALSFCSTISKVLHEDHDHSLNNYIFELLSDEITNCSAYAVGDSPFFFEPDVVELKLVNFEYAENESGGALLQPVQGQANSLIVEAKLRVTVEASTTFSLSVRDSIDKDYVSMGSTPALVETDFEVEVLLTFEGDFSSRTEDIELTDLELLSEAGEIDFGSIEPEYFYDE